MSLVLFSFHIVSHLWNINSYLVMSQKCLVVPRGIYELCENSITDINCVWRGKELLLILSASFQILCRSMREKGHMVRSWLRHYATSQKVVGSIPDVIWFFNWPNPYSHTMALGSTQPLTEMSTRNLPGSKGRPVHKADNLTAVCEPTV
jgi:hypothetical protein